MKMNIKRINELFDSEELKSDMRDEFEIPYLRGDLGKHAATKWKKVSNHLISKHQNHFIKR